MTTNATGKPRQAARTRTYADLDLHEAIRAEQRADKALHTAAKRFAEAVKYRSMLVANQLDGEGGYALQVAREALIAAGVFTPTAYTGQPKRRAIHHEVRRAVFERDMYRRVKCGTHLDLTLDHIHPYSKGGQDTADKLQVLCRSCNSTKGAKL